MLGTRQNDIISRHIDYVLLNAAVEKQSVLIMLVLGVYL